jgi:hypothetical protein
MKLLTNHLSSIVGVRIAPEAANTKNTLITVSLEKFNGILVYAYCDNELTFLKKILCSGPVWDHQFINAIEVALLQAKGQEISKRNWRFQVTKKPTNFCPSIYKVFKSEK